MPTTTAALGGYLTEPASLSLHLEGLPVQRDRGGLAILTNDTFPVGSLCRVDRSEEKIKTEIKKK